MKKRQIIISEFAIQVHTDGKIIWDGFDSYLWRRIHHHCPVSRTLNIAQMKRDLFSAARKDRRGQSR